MAALPFIVKPATSKLAPLNPALLHAHMCHLIFGLRLSINQESIHLSLCGREPGDIEALNASDVGNWHTFRGIGRKKSFDLHELTWPIICYLPRHLRSVQLSTSGAPTKKDQRSDLKFVNQKRWKMHNPCQSQINHQFKICIGIAPFR